MDHESTHKMPSGKNQHWRYTRRLTTGLLIIWATLCFCILFFARELDGLSFFGWPFSFYMAAQGLTLSFVLILASYSVGMHIISRQQRGN
jgi:putative solute:sodium symporter small subunit